MDHDADPEAQGPPPSFLTPLPGTALWAWYAETVDPLSGGDTRLFVGIYGHPAPADSGFKSFEVKDTWTNEAIHFASSYMARSGLWLRILIP